MASNQTVLVVDDEPDARQLLTKVLEKEGFRAKAVDCAEAAFAVLRQERVPVVLLDHHLPGEKGIDAVEKILVEDPDIKIIMVTAHGSIKLAVEAVKKGAFNFLEKPFDLDEVRLTVRQAIDSYNVNLRNRQMAEQIRDASQTEYVLGKSPAMQAVWRTVAKVAPSDACVLIEGESGSGKEVVAKAIHQNSARRDKAFVALNCAALSRELIETELFGHIKGAFTGAIAMRKGRFEVADGGTLFLDEIGEIPIDLQAKLLRVVQERSFERVGETISRTVDVRILAATNRDLQQAVAQGTFREDLYFRLNVINLKIPPLRERQEDIVDLSQFFLARLSVERGRTLANLSPAALQFLMNYSFPGNIRELANMIERASILCSHNTILPQDLAPQGGPANEKLLKQTPPENLGEAKPFAAAKEEFEMAYLTRLLLLAKGNISMAARMAEMDRNNFKDKLKKYGVQGENFKE